MQEKRILVLCVDRDGDLGEKANIQTPVIGRGENLDAAVNLVLNDPEEPDANAMFEAVKIYDRLKSENKPEETFEIATICGSAGGRVQADRKIVAELNGLLGKFPANEVILVVDGYSDEAITPLVQSRIPVSSVRRIVVKHSESIEETAAVFSHYLKMLVEDPRYSRWVIGVPGILALILGILSMLDLLSRFWIYAVLVLGVIMAMKGFGADRATVRFYRWVRSSSPPPLRKQISMFSSIAGVLLLVLGIYLGWMRATEFIAGNMQIDISGWLSILPQISGWFIKGATTLIVVGVCVMLVGSAIRLYLERDPRLLRNAALVFSVAWSIVILDTTADLLTNLEASAFGTLIAKLIFSVVVGVLIGIVSVLVIVVAHRSMRGFFSRTEEKVEEFGVD